MNTPKALVVAAGLLLLFLSVPAAVAAPAATAIRAQVPAATLTPGPESLIAQGDALYIERLETILTMEPLPDLLPETVEEREQARERLERKPFKKK